MKHPPCPLCGEELTFNLLEGGYTCFARPCGFDIGTRGPFPFCSCGNMIVPSENSEPDYLCVLCRRVYEDLTSE